MPFYKDAMFWVTTALAVFTGLLFLATYVMVKRAKRDSERQAKEMATSIDAAVRAATAMERVAESGSKGAAAAFASVATVKERTALQMRAYVTVNINSGLYQDRKKGISFGVTPKLMNTGQTPAHNVRYAAHADLWPVPLPRDFKFPLLRDPRGAALLGPHQEMTFTTVVEGMIPDELVEKVKLGQSEKHLYGWGIVHYEDVFGESHFTRFCHHIFWLQTARDPDSFEITGFYLDQHNDAD